MKSVIMILGMHRSGTSCLTGSLQQRGLYLGEVYTANPYNKKGNREHARIMQLNNSLLEWNSGDWQSPPSNIEWNNEHVEERDSIIREFNLTGESIWGFKDPRLLFTFPFWKAGLANFRLVGTYRHPISVAKSLNHRNNLTIEEGLGLWYTYNKQLVELINTYNFPLISFDVDRTQYLASVEYVVNYLGLPISTTPFQDSFFTNELRTQNHSSEINLPIHVAKLYSELSDNYEKVSVQIKQM